MVTQWYPLARWYASDGARLVEDVRNDEEPRADAEPRVRFRASRRAAEFVRGGAHVVAVRRQRA